MLGWASQQFEKLSQTVAPPPADANGRFVYAVQRGDEDAAMACVPEMDPARAVLNPTKRSYAIHLACEHSLDRLIRLLLTQPGVDLTFIDSFGNTPLHYACMSTDKGRALPTIKMLVTEFKASVVAKNSMGQTPYDLASLDMVRQFLLPLQLQEETRQAIDNGGVGLPPGIDLGGLRIANPVAPPPPVMPIAPAPMSSPAPHAYPTPQHDPPKPPSSAQAGGYARSGGSSAAIYKPSGQRYVKADGFHSSSSDVSLQRKYGHVQTQYGNIAPPPSSGNAAAVGSAFPPPGGANPYAGGNNPYASGRANQRYVAYNAVTGQTSSMPRTVASPPAYGHPAATASTPNYAVFSPGGAPAASASAPPPAANMYNPVASSPAASTPVAQNPYATSQPYQSPHEAAGAPYQQGNYCTGQQQFQSVQQAHGAFAGGGSPYAQQQQQQPAHGDFVGGGSPYAQQQQQQQQQPMAQGASAPFEAPAGSQGHFHPAPVAAYPAASSPVSSSSVFTPMKADSRAAANVFASPASGGLGVGQAAMSPAAPSGVAQQANSVFGFPPPESQQPSAQSAGIVFNAPPRNPTDDGANQVAGAMPGSDAPGTPAASSVFAVPPANQSTPVQAAEHAGVSAQPTPNNEFGVTPGSVPNEHTMSAPVPVQAPEAGVVSPQAPASAFGAPQAQGGQTRLAQSGTPSAATNLFAAPPNSQATPVQAPHEDDAAASPHPIGDAPVPGNLASEGSPQVALAEPSSAPGTLSATTFFGTSPGSQASAVQATESTTAAVVGVPAGTPVQATSRNKEENVTEEPSASSFFGAPSVEGPRHTVSSPLLSSTTSALSGRESGEGGRVQTEDRSSALTQPAASVFGAPPGSQPGGTQPASLEPSSFSAGAPTAASVFSAPQGGQVSLVQATGHVVPSTQPVASVFNAPAAGPPAGSQQAAVEQQSIAAGSTAAPSMLSGIQGSQGTAVQAAGVFSAPQGTQVAPTGGPTPTQAAASVFSAPASNQSASVEQESKVRGMAATATSVFGTAAGQGTPPPATGHNPGVPTQHVAGVFGAPPGSMPAQPSPARGGLPVAPTSAGFSLADQAANSAVASDLFASPAAKGNSAYEAAALPPANGDPSPAKAAEALIAQALAAQAPAQEQLPPTPQAERSGSPAGSDEGLDDVPLSPEVQTQPAVNMSRSNGPVSNAAEFPPPPVGQMQAPYGPPETTGAESLFAAIGMPPPPFSSKR